MLGAVDVFKQVIIRKGEVPALNMFGRAIIKPNGRVPKHTHTNMDEVRGGGMTDYSINTTACCCLTHVMLREPNNSSTHNL